MNLIKKAELLDKANEVYVLTRSRSINCSTIPLNEYFAEFDFWDEEIKSLNLQITKRNIYHADLALSYRHLQQEVKNGKYLTKDCLDFIKEHKEAIEGLWVDVLCIAPAQIKLSDAFKQMGRLYKYTVVFPYWVRQPQPEKSVKRGWIFQESMFPKFSSFAISDERYLENHVFKQLMATRVTDSGMRSVNEFNTSVNLVDVIVAYLTYDVEVETDIDEAILGVLREDRECLNYLDCLKESREFTCFKSRFYKIFKDRDLILIKCYGIKSAIQLIRIDDLIKLTVVDATNFDFKPRDVRSKVYEDLEVDEAVFENGATLYYKYSDTGKIDLTVEDYVIPKRKPKLLKYVKGFEDEAKLSRVLSLRTLTKENYLSDDCTAID